MTRTAAVPIDPALPGLADLLPTAGAPPPVAEFARTLAPDVDTAAARLLYVRYRPTRSCVGLWVFRRPSGRSLILYAKLVAGARGVQAAREGLGALVARFEQMRGGAPWRVLPERGIVLHAFGLDPRLPSLLYADDHDWARSELAPSLGLPHGSALAAVQPLSYKPERRCVFHYRWAAGGISHYAKLFRDDRGRQLLTWQEQLSDQLRESGAAWEIAAPVAYLAKPRMLVFPTVEGEMATRSMEAVAEQRAPLDWVVQHAGRAAQGLGALQRCRLEGLPEWPPEEYLARFGRAADRVALVDPEVADAVRQRLDGLETLRAAFAPESLVPSHGAFRHGQLLLRRDSCVVLDFDTLCRSGASADAGNFLAYLDLTARRRPRLRPVLEACREAFLAELPEPHSPWLAWYRAVSQLKIALRSFLSLDAGWPGLVTAMLCEVDGALGRRPAGAGRAAAC